MFSRIVRIGRRRLRSLLACHLRPIAQLRLERQSDIPLHVFAKSRPRLPVDRPPFLPRHPRREILVVDEDRHIKTLQRPQAPATIRREPERQICQRQARHLRRLHFRRRPIPFWSVPRGSRQCPFTHLQILQPTRRHRSHRAAISEATPDRGQPRPLLMHLPTGKQSPQSRRLEAIRRPEKQPRLHRHRPRHIPPEHHRPASQPSHRMQPIARQPVDQLLPSPVRDLTRLPPRDLLQPHPAHPLRRPPRTLSLGQRLRIPPRLLTWPNHVRWQRERHPLPVHPSERSIAHRLFCQV